jgi:hypothetical protein
MLVCLQIDPLVGHPVSRQELAQAARVGREARADQLDPRFGIDQDRSPGDERPEDQIAQRLVLVDDFAQLVQGNLDQLPGVTDDPGEIEPLADDQAELPQEPVGPLDRDHPILLAQPLDDRHRT